MPSESGPTWRWASDPPSERAVRHAERFLGVTFPPDYRACLKRNGGGAPDPSSFQVRMGPDRSLRHAVGILMTVDLQESENVLTTVDDLDIKRQRPEGIVPIINDGEGSFVCLDYRDDPTRSRPTIVFWSLAEEGSGEFFPLAPSFSGFLAGLS